MRRVLVTGGAGFVGLALVRRLLAKGVEVVAVGRHHSPDVEGAGAVMLVGDIRDGDFMVQAAKGCDTVFHVAAKAGIWGSWQEYYSINVQGTENVIKACQENDVAALVYTGTPSVVFSGSDIDGENEDLPYATTFLCHYARSKCLAEQLVLAANGEYLRTVSLRPHLIWGPGDPNLIPRILARARKGVLRQVGDGHNLVDISYIDNVVDAHLLAAADLESEGRAAGKPYFISQGEPVNLWEWINELLAAMAIPPVSKKLSFTGAYWTGALMEAVYWTTRRRDEPLMTRFLAEQLAMGHWFSIVNAARDFGYFPRVSNASGMKRLVDWLKDEIR